MNSTDDFPHEFQHEFRCLRWIGATAVLVGLLFAAASHAVAAPAQRLVRECVAFEDLAMSARYEVGDSFTSEGRNFSVHSFTWDDGRVTTEGFVEVKTEGMAGGSGQDLEVNNANLAVELPTAVQGISLRYGESGGNLNIRINGDFRNFEEMIDIDGAVIGAVNVSVLDLGDGLGVLDVRAPDGGSIREFGIGGQEFFVDNVCVYAENDEPDPDDPSPAGRDLGDAPDSTNHAGIANSAYPGAGVNGNYPTVWESAVGPSGPMHQNAGRQALLGNALSREREADAGFDADGVNNILNGGADNANNDHFDDGWRNRGILLADCRRATLRVRVRKAAAATLEKMFLNVWFDGTSDGDWDDTGVCIHPATGQTLRSFEWIVQDFVVDLTAIAPGGFVDIPVSTELVMNLEPDMPHWVRFTLSERAAVHPPAGSLADGRGPAHPNHYEFGETEDYLWRPANNPGVDVGIRKSGRVFQEFDPEEGRVVSKIAWLVEFGNRGDRQASNVVIRDTLGQDQNIIAILIGLLHDRTDIPQERDGDAIIFQVDALEPGEHGRITIITKVEQRSTELHRFTNRAEIRAADDVNASNNVAEASVAVGVRPPHILSPVDGTTCDAIVEVTGRSEANAAINIYVNGALAATVAADDEGRWRRTLELSDGPHTISATASIGAVTSPPSQVVKLIVNISLPWDPISLTFTNENGRSRRPVDEQGRTDEDGWRLNLRPNTTFTVSVRICCEKEPVTVSLFVEGSGDIALTDADGDGIYTGVFTTGPRNPEAVEMSLTVVCGETEVIGSGTVILIDPAGTVYDVTTGAVLADATIACMQGEGDFFTLWDAESFDQVNPQSTLADGFFSFLTPPGAYRLDVNHTGYQPYRSPTLEVASDPVIYDAPLTPVIDEAADHRIEISEFGYEPGVLAVKPGDVIEWVNLDGAGHSATSFQEAGATATSVGEVAWDSGLLATGESYKFRAGVEGIYTYSDRANPANSATLTVDDNADDPGFDISVFLPLVNQ